MNTLSNTKRLANEGFLVFQVDLVQHKVDAFEAYHEILELNGAHPGTREFHAAVREYMISLGLPAGSDRMADVFTGAIFKRINALKSKRWGRRYADIARFYHLNPFALQRHELAILDINLEPILAEEILQRGGGRTAKSVYQLTLAATGDKEAAEEARAKFCEDAMRNDETVPME